MTRQRGSPATDTVLRFYRAIDDRDYQTLLSLLAPDGVWHRQGNDLRGEQAIMAAMAQRSPTLRIVHIVTNLFMQEAGNEEILVSGYMLIALHDPNADHEGPAPLAGIDSIRPTAARLRLIDGDWRIVSIGSSPPTFVA